MRFPITRESIKAYLATELEELRKEEIEKCFTVALNDLCEDFRKNIRSNPKDTTFIWSKLQSPRYFSPYLWHDSMGQDVIIRFVLGSDEHLPRFLEKVNELFIGCDISVDPLKAYISIGWS
jgi:hypothetical protein